MTRFQTPAQMLRSDLKCMHLASWLSSRMTEMAGDLAQNFARAQAPSTSAAEAQASKHLVAALVRHDIDRVRDISDAAPTAAEWSRLASATIVALEVDWLEKRIGMHEAAGAFWMLKKEVERRRLEGASQIRPVQMAERVLLCTPRGELHSFAIELIFEQLAHRGLPADLHTDQSHDAIADRIATGDYGVLGLSIGCDEQLDGLANLVARVKHASIARQVKVIIGGPVFTGAEREYSFLGADRVFGADSDISDFLDMLRPDHAGAAAYGQA